MNRYELLLVLPGTLEENGATDRAVEIINLIKDAGGSAISEIKECLLGKNRLAYPIKNIRYGYFYAIVFSAEPHILPELTKRFNLCRDLLRAVVTHFDVHAAANQKVAYFTDSLGATNIMEEGHREEDLAYDSQYSEERATSGKKVDLKEIDKKLDEILRGDLILEI